MFDSASFTLLERIFQTVFPLVAIVLVGFFYARRKQTDMTVANQLNMDVFTPALVFSVLSAESFDLPEYASLALGGVGVVLGSGLLLWPLCRFLNVAPKTLLPPMMFNNSGNMGIPLVLLAFGEAALPAAVVLFLIENLLHFSLGIYMLDKRTNPLALLKVPVIITTIAGLIWSSSGLDLPKAAQPFVDMLGAIAIPLMLFSLGVRMTSIDFSNWKIGVWGALLCPLSGLVCVAVLQPFLHLDNTQLGYLILFAALPPAVLNYMVAERYNQDPHQVASIVLLGNIGSLLIIPLTLAFIL